MHRANQCQTFQHPDDCKDQLEKCSSFSSKTLVCSAHTCKCRDGWSIFNLKSKCACTTLVIGWQSLVKMWDRKKETDRWIDLWSESFCFNAFYSIPVCLTHIRSTHACVHLALRLCVCLFCRLSVHSILHTIIKQKQTARLYLIHRPLINLIKNTILHFNPMKKSMCASVCLVEWWWEPSPK